MLKMFDHPVEIQELVKKLVETKKGTHSRRDDYFYDKSATVSEMLFWNNTPQGAHFWGLIHNGEYDEAKRLKCYPKPLDLIVNNFQIF